MKDSTRAALAFVILAVSAVAVAAQARPDPVPVARMNAARAAHTATRLLDGRVLVAGGFREEGTAEVPLSSAEIFDPSTGTFTGTGGLIDARDGHTATLLQNGDVLIAGGWGSHGRLAGAEVYDHRAGRFLRVGSMASPRQGMTATLLADGQVLIAGGDSARGTPVLLAELYDPDTRTFRAAGHLLAGRSAFASALLRDGRVLLTGGLSGRGDILASAEICNPATDTFSAARSMAVPRYKHAAVSLPAGDVLVLGGSDNRDWAGMYSSAEIFHPATGTFRNLPALNRARFKISDAVVTLPSGLVLVAGGDRLVEVYDPAAGRFFPGQLLDDAYFFSVAARLDDDSVLLTGGYTARIQPTDKAWLLRPAR